MEKLAYFFIDDVIWTFRDIANDRPKSIFDNPFMAVLKKAHDMYGLTVQLNLFYRTDFFYGSIEFNLSMMPDCYKPEFEANSDWLKLAFHAKQEFPDYPYVNAKYDDVVYDVNLIKNEVLRFAGEKSWACAVVPHWLPISKEGCQALLDCGIKFVSAGYGERVEYDKEKTPLSDLHLQRFMYNRSPDTMVYIKKYTYNNKSNEYFISSHNHVTEEKFRSYFGTNTSVVDEETGIRYRQFGHGPTLNKNKLEDLAPEYEKLIGNAYIGTGNHEQYFYSDYVAYQPDYGDKIMLMAKIMHENGYRYITADEFK